MANNNARRLRPEPGEVLAHIEDRVAEAAA
jgi:hypothetical protein